MKAEKYTVNDRLFKSMHKFVKYVNTQGGQGLDVLDKEIAPLVDELITITKVFNPKLVLSFGIKKAMTCSSAEQIIDRGLLDGMNRKKYYKEIYKDVRSKVELFAELHGKSEVISKQLAMES